MKIAVQLEPALGSLAEVVYTWDPDTEILSAQLKSQTRGPSVDGMSGSVGLEGDDGSWLILDVAAGRISGVEVAVWPQVRQLATLIPPTRVEDAHVHVPSRRSQPNIASVEMAAKALIAETDGRTFHFRLGKPRQTRAVRLGRDLLLDIDDKNQITGVWLLNVPAAPAPTVPEDL